MILPSLGGMPATQVPLRIMFFLLFGPENAPSTRARQVLVEIRE